MSNSFSRKLNRKKTKESKKELQQKVKLLSKTPENCNMCDASFDKTDKEQVMSWYVVVRENVEKVNLYCPECWGRANELIEQLREGLDEQN